MRKIIFIGLFAFLANTLSAQDVAPDTTQHLLDLKWTRPQYLGVFVAPEFQYGQLNGAFTSMSGASAMLLLNKKWGIGVTGQRSIDRAFSPSGVTPLYLSTQFGGLKMEYTPRPNAAIHVTFPLVVGMGVASADSLSSRNGRDDLFEFGGKKNRGNDNRNSFVVIQPSIQVEANLVRFVKLFAGVNYRLAFKENSTINTLPSNTLQGISFNFGAKMGLFDFHVKQKAVVLQ